MTVSIVRTFFDRFGEDMKIRENNSDSFLAVVSLSVSHVFYSWIFGFWGKVKIKGPSYVKERYADMLREAMVGLQETYI